MLTAIPDSALPRPTGYLDGEPFWATDDTETASATDEGVVLLDEGYRIVEGDVDHLERSALAVLAAIRQYRSKFG
jgi:hypothetical protein